jgi:predicted amidohydrolase
MRVAAVQFCPVFKDREANLRTAANLVIQAAKGGATLIVLPELCTSGYSFMSAVEAEPYSEVISGYLRSGARSMEVFGTLAQKLGVNIVWGVMEKDYGTGNLYNSQVLMTPTAKFVSYRKVNPWGQDWLWSQKGESNPPIHVIDGRKVGLLICRDVRDKVDDNWKSFYEKGDADIVCLSANWGDGGFPSVSWMSFVEDNNTALIVANRYGREENNDFGEGGICVIYPDQKVVCDGLKWNQDCIVHAEV